MVRIKNADCIRFSTQRQGSILPSLAKIINEGETGAKKTETKSTSKKKSKSSLPDSKEPLIVLEDNKYILNEAAAEALGVSPDDRIDIKYEKQGKLLKPVIGSNEAFGTKGGNKLTNSLTVSCRGKANETLSEYGSQFTLVPHAHKDGLFMLIGDKTPEEPQSTDDKIDTSKVDEEPSEDIPLDIQLANMIQDDSVEEDTITSFDFTLK